MFVLLGDRISECNVAISRPHDYTCSQSEFYPKVYSYCNDKRRDKTN